MTYPANGDSPAIGRLGILGGTFDPIHYAHLFIAEEARLAFALDGVVFVPNGSPPHKRNRKISAANDREAMTQLAVRGNAAFWCSDVELRRTGPSFTVDTLRELQSLYPQAALYYICGVDTALDLINWRRPDEVIQMTRFIAAVRPGFDLAQAATALPATYLDRIDFLDTVPLEISATEIRHRIQSGKSARYLLPDPVLDYIREHRLYT